MRRKRSDASLQNRQDGVASSRMARRLRHQRTAALLSMAKMLMLWATLGVVPEQDRRDTRDTSRAGQRSPSKESGHSLPPVPPGLPSATKAGVGMFNIKAKENAGGFFSWGRLINNSNGPA